MTFLNPQVQQVIEEIKLQKQLQDKLLKEKSKDLYFFNKELLHAEDGRGKVPLAQFHKDLCHFVQDEKHKKKLILMPRGHLKSTLVTVGYCVQQIVENPDIRILILNATWQMAVDFLGEIKKQLTQNEDLIRLWGPLAENPIEWSQDRITLNTPGMKFGKKEPTVTAFGIDSNLVSQHYDMIIMDDVVNRENTSTKEQLEKVILRYKDCLDLLEPRGQLIIIGTRWHFDDLYGWIMEPDGNRLSQFNIMIKRALEGDLFNEEIPPEILWPEKYTRKDLQILYKEKGSAEFANQYLNEPIASEDAKFKREWFRYIDDSDIRGLPLNKYLLIDTAFEVKKDSDYTALVTIGVDDQKQIYILDVIRERMLPDRTIQYIFNLANIHKYTGIGIEDITFGKTLQFHLYDEMRARTHYLPIIKLKAMERSKEARVMGLQPLYESGRIFHNKTSRGIQYIEDELIRYPKTQHDDCIDALAYGLDFIQAARVKQEGRWKHRFLY